MADQLASLTIQVDSRSAVAAKQATDGLTRSVAATEATLAELLAVSKQASAATQQMATTMQQAAQQAAAERAQSQAVTNAKRAETQARQQATQAAQQSAVIGRRVLTDTQAAVAATTTSARGATTAMQALSATAPRLAGLASSIAPVGVGLGLITAGAVAAYRALQPIIRAGNEYTNIGNRLRVVSGSFADATAAQRQLFALSQQTGASFATVVQSYARTALAAKDLGATQSQMVAATGAVAKALQISGASAAEASSAAQQLAQALAAGRLQGDELRSILENAPVLARAIADGLGVSVGQLRQMGAEGKLLSSDVLAAILRQTGEIDAQFAKIAGTVDQATQRISDAWTRAVAAIDAKLSASSRFATLLDIISGTLTLGPGTVIGAILGANANAANGASDSVAGRLRTARDRQAAAEAEAARIQQQTSRNPLFAPMGGGFGPGLGKTGNAFRFSGLFSETPNATLPGVAQTVADLGLTPKAKKARAGLNSALDAWAEEQDGIAEMTKRAVERARARTDAKIGQAFDSIVPASLGGGTSSKSDPDKFASSAATAVDKVVSSAREGSEKVAAWAQSLANGLQNTFASGFQDLFTKGLSSAKDFATSLRDTLLRAFSEVLASAITRRLFGALASLGGAGGAGSITGAVGSGGGVVGALSSLGGVGKLLKGGTGVADPAKIKTLATAASSGGLSLTGALGIGGGALLAGSLLGQSAGTGAGALGGAAGGALAGLAFGGPLGALVGGVGGLIGGLFGGRSKKAKQDEAARKLAEDAAAFSDDLIARTLEATGDTLGAQKARLAAQQKQELDAARARFGAQSQQVRDLMKLQGLELDKLTSENSSMASGTYLAPSGFNAAAYRFRAGRPTSAEMSQTITTGPVTIVLDKDSPSNHAQQIVRELQALATAQGMTPTDWSRVDVQ